MKSINFLAILLFVVCPQFNFAQHHRTDEEIEQTSTIKIEHAEPLYIDLIRDLGARKGEREWNIGMGLTDQHHVDQYVALVEYEWAPINRLGLEVELPFTFYSRFGSKSKDSSVSHRLNGLKTAIQYTFFVHPTWRTSMAIGYINELELPDFRNFGNPVITGNAYNPFIVGAKRWGKQCHSLIYTGPRINQHFSTAEWHSSYELNTSFHYSIPLTRNFIGMEINSTFGHDYQHVVLRPQMRLAIVDNMMIGILAGIPTSKKVERFSAFFRLIWEPKHHKVNA